MFFPYSSFWRLFDDNYHYTSLTALVQIPSPPPKHISYQEKIKTSLWVEGGSSSAGARVGEYDLLQIIIRKLGWNTNNWLERWKFTLWRRGYFWNIATATDKNNGFYHFYLRAFYNLHDYHCGKPHHYQLEVAEDKIRGWEKTVPNFIESPGNSAATEVVRYIMWV